MKKQRTLFFYVLLWTVFLLPATAFPADKYWVEQSTSDYWHQDFNLYTYNNWSTSDGGAGTAGRPVDGDSAYLYQSGAADNTVIFGYDSYTYTMGSLVDLKINATGTGTITLSQSYNNIPMAAETETIGTTGTGSYIHKHGNNTTDDLIIGQYSTGNGAYTLQSDSSASVTVDDRLYMGSSGTGTFNQSTGSVTVGQDTDSSTTTEGLYLGYYSGSSGTYNLSGGSLTVYKTENIGRYGNGKFTQTGGTHTISLGSLYLGQQSSGIGVYELEGGTLSATSEIIGNYSVGNTSGNRSEFLHSGGSNDISSYLYLGYGGGSYGRYLLTGAGDLQVNSSTYVGYSGNADFYHSGGDATLSSMYLGYLADSIGRYDFVSGTLDDTYVYIGYYSQGDAARDDYSEFYHAGGTHTVSGTLYLGSKEDSTGKYTIYSYYNDPTSPVLNANRLYIGNNGTGIFTQAYGTTSVTGDLYLGFGETGQGSYTMEYGSQLSAANEYIGFDGRGTFIQNDGTNSVSGTLAIGSHPGGSGTYTLESGNLSVGNLIIDSQGLLTQNGGVIEGQGTSASDDGYVQNYGRYLNYGGTITEKLINYNDADFYSNTSSVEGGIENVGALDIWQDATLILLKDGLDNQGYLRLYGTIRTNTYSYGYQTVENNGYMYGAGKITGYTRFINNSLFEQASSGPFTLDNEGTNSNYGNMLLSNHYPFRIESNLSNMGTLDLNEGSIVGDGSLTNGIGGLITGPGTISTSFENGTGGVTLSDSGNLRITNNFSNAGFIHMGGNSASLNGGTITNNGTIDGYGLVGNQVNNSGNIEASGGTLTFSQAVNNQASGMMYVTQNSKLMLLNGLSANTGGISLTGGTLDTNTNTLTSAGKITGYGTINTGRLSNTGSMTLTGGSTTINGDVTNASGAFIEIAYDSALFTGDVVNNGTFKTTDTNVTFAGSYTENGAYISDPSDNYYAGDLTINTGGYLQGGIGDTFYLGGDFINHSQKNKEWDTEEADFFLYLGGSHEFYLTGLDLGAVEQGYEDNFAIGSLTLRVEIH
jgi:hypothetical protein